MKKYAIINADDYGFSPKVNEGIIIALTEGIVSDLSMLAVGEAFSEGVTRLKEQGVTDIGVHLCLSSSDWRPLQMSRFPKNCFTLFSGMLLGHIKKEDIYTEIKEQIKKIKDQGFNISHMDSHEHVHMFLPLTEMIAQIADEEDIPLVRVPDEKIKIRFCKEPLNFIRSLALKIMCRLSKNKIPRKISGKFFGHFHSGQLVADDVLSFFEDMTDGVNEIGCHPGKKESSLCENDQWRENAQQELAIFTSQQVKAKMNHKNIELITYKDAALL